MKIKSKILIIAGSDSSGGAGIQADIKAVTALGSYATTAITAITAQNTTGVKKVLPISSKIVQKQITMILDDIKVHGVKIGMLHNSKVIRSVYKTLKKYKLKYIVLDPVMIAKGGTRLINNNSISYLKKLLLPICYLVTPNIPEAEIMTGYSISNKNDMIKAAKKIINMGAKNVLLKGGHLKNKMIFDILVSKQSVKIFSKKKINTRNTHGTGCTLSSAITTFFACGKTLKKSCELGIKYVNRAIRFNLNYGKGHGPINHLNSIIINKKFR